jgi:hypothetical protein
MLSARNIRHLHNTTDRVILSSHTEFFGLRTKACRMTFTLRADLMVTRGSFHHLDRRLFRTAPPVAECLVRSWIFPHNSFRSCHMSRTQPSAAQIPVTEQLNLAHAHIHPRSVQYARQIKGSEFLFHATKTALLFSTI